MINAEDLSSVGHSIPCSAVTLDPAVAEGLTAVAGTQFEPTDHSAMHLIELAIIGNPAQLAADMRAMSLAMDRCSRMASTAMGGSTLSVKPFDLPRMGDQQAAYAMTDMASLRGGFYVRNALVRVGSVVVAVGLAEVMASPNSQPQVSDSSFVHIVETAVHKMTG